MHKLCTELIVISAYVRIGFTLEQKKNAIKKGLGMNS
jgi:hypothetical protein